MAQAIAATTVSDLNIPAEVSAKFPDIIRLIQKSQSIDNDERQYWIDVLPIMNDDQMENLKSILDNEQKELSELDGENNESEKEDVKMFNLEFDKEKYEEKKRLRMEAEQREELAEKQEEAAVLEELANL